MGSYGKKSIGTIETRSLFLPRVSVTVEPRSIHYARVLLVESQARVAAERGRVRGEGRDAGRGDGADAGGRAGQSRRPTRTVNTTAAVDR